MPVRKIIQAGQGPQGRQARRRLGLGRLRLLFVQLEGREVFQEQQGLELLQQQQLERLVPGTWGLVQAEWWRRLAQAQAERRRLVQAVPSDGLVEAGRRRRLVQAGWE